MTNPNMQQLQQEIKDKQEYIGGRLTITESTLLRDMAVTQVLYLIYRREVLFNISEGGFI